MVNMRRVVTKTLPVGPSRDSHIVRSAGRVREVGDPVNSGWRELFPGPYRWRLVLIRAVVLLGDWTRLMIG